MSARASVSAFAPATVGSLGPGIGVLGLALGDPGNTVTAQLTAGSEVRLVKIDGGAGDPTGESGATHALAAAMATLRRAGVEAGIEIALRRGIAAGSGLGDFAATAAAAAYAVNLLIGSPLRKVELLGACLAASGTLPDVQADNVAPALLGGMILVHSVEPLDLIRLPVPEGLTIVVATPRVESKASHPSPASDSVPLLALAHAAAHAAHSAQTAPAAHSAQTAHAAHSAQTAHAAAMVAACHSGDLALLGRALQGAAVGPTRSRVIPACDAVFAAALDAGALGTSIAGAGPSIVALCRSPHSASEVATAMIAAFAGAGLESTTTISAADCPGARRI